MPLQVNMIHWYQSLQIRCWYLPILIHRYGPLCQPREVRGIYHPQQHQQPHCSTTEQLHCLLTIVRHRLVTELNSHVKLLFKDIRQSATISLLVINGKRKCTCDCPSFMHSPPRVMLSFRHLCQAAHKCLALQSQGVWQPLQSSAGTCVHVVHIKKTRHAHMHIKEVPFEKCLSTWTQAVDG